MDLSEYASYDYMGDLTSITDANAQVSNAEYDGFGRLTAIIKPGDSHSYPTESFAYNDTATPFQYTISKREYAGSGDYLPTQQFYNGFGELIQTKSESNWYGGPQNIVVDKLYDGMGQVIRESQPRYVSESATGTFWHYLSPPILDLIWTATFYDGLGRKTSVQGPGTWGNPGPIQTSMLYWIAANPDGPVTSVTDPNGNHTRSEYDMFGRLLRVREADDLTQVTQYTYNVLDLLIQVQDRQNNFTTIAYDSLGRKTSMHDPDMTNTQNGAWSYSYDPNGTLHSQTDPKGQTTNLYYDNLDRLVLKQYPNNQNSVQYVYDTFVSGYYNKGRETGMGKGNAIAYMNYDQRGRVATASYSNYTGPYLYSYTYNSGDQVTATTYPDGEVINNTFDGAWRPLSASSSWGDWSVSGATYDAQSQPLSLSVSNGDIQSWSYYTPTQRLQNTTVSKGGTALFSHSYDYDLAANVTAITNTVQADTQHFTYDSLNRLTNACTVDNTQQHNCTLSTSYSFSPYNEHYTYDSIGNLTNKAGLPYGYGRLVGSYLVGPHQATTVNGGLYDYDANGNMIDGADGSLYTWNVDNQPSSIRGANAVTEQYTYDANGGRATRIHNGVTTTYLGDSLEVDSGSSIDYRKTYSFSGRVVAQRDAPAAGQAGSLTYLFGDNLGSVSLSTNSSGNVVQRQEYKPWGEERVSPAMLTTLNFTGQKKDATGLLYYNARYYNQQLSRFVSADSIVPGSASAKGLTVDYHETGFATDVAQENALTLQKGFYFQLSNHDRQNAKSPSGPGNPQTLNRYSYATDNPEVYTDASGHDPNNYLAEVNSLAQQIYQVVRDANAAGGLTSAMTQHLNRLINSMIGLLLERYTQLNGGQELTPEALATLLSTDRDHLAAFMMQTIGIAMYYEMNGRLPDFASLDPNEAAQEIDSVIQDKLIPILVSNVGGYPAGHLSWNWDEAGNTASDLNDLHDTWKDGAPADPWLIMPIIPGVTDCFLNACQYNGLE